MSAEKTPITLTPQDLKDIVATAVEAAVKAAKAPNEVEQRKLDADKRAYNEAQEMRKETSAGVLAQIENKRAVQRICSHKHRDGNSHCVLIPEKSGPGYILCQKNQCKVRPGLVPDGYKGGDIYDTRLFNELLQTLPSAELFQ